MTNVTIIGTGNMGQTIAGLVARGGHTVQVLGEADADQVVTGDVVVLAVPYGAVSQVVSERAASLVDKVVVDITNPVDFQTFDSLTVPPDSSATAQIAAALPGSKVVKAFNTTFAGTLVSGDVGPLPTTVLLAGDDVAAKAAVAAVVADAGLQAVDAGALKRARELEAIGFLQITLAASEKVGWEGGFGVVA